MIFYTLTPRQEVIDAAHNAGAKIVPVANAEFLSSLESFDGETVEVHDPLDALGGLGHSSLSSVQQASRVMHCVLA